MKINHDRRQLMALIFVSSLAPAVRLMPKFNAQTAGSAGWLAPLVALPFLIIYVWFLSAFMAKRKSGEGLGELIMRTNGKAFGSFVLCATAAFLIFCCGFILRSGAERFICTIYPAGNAWPFVIVMLALGLIAALGPRKALLRSARIFSPLLVIVPVLVLVFALTNIELDRLLPLSKGAPDKLGLAAVPMLEIYAGIFVYAAFLERTADKTRGRAKAYSLWLVPVCLLFAVLSLAAIGNYGAELTSRFSYPFFAMIQNVSIFHTVERIEAPVVALWVLPDFVIFALMLIVAVHCLRLVFGYVPETKEAPRTDMTNGRFFILAAAALIAVVAALLDLDSDNLDFYSQLVVPIANMAIVFVLLPISFLVANLRKP